jgi:hypothetical protein
LGVRFYPSGDNRRTKGAVKLIQNAEEARAATKIGKEENSVGPAVETALHNISIAASQGKNSINIAYSLKGTRFDDRKEIIHELVKLGFEYVHHKGYDQRDPVWDEIKW